MPLKHSVAESVDERLENWMVLILPCWTNPTSRVFMFLAIRMNCDAPQRAALDEAIKHFLLEI